MWKIKPVDDAIYVKPFDGPSHRPDQHRADDKPKEEEEKSDDEGEFGCGAREKMDWNHMYTRIHHDKLSHTKKQLEKSFSLFSRAELCALSFMHHKIRTALMETVELLLWKIIQPFSSVCVGEWKIF